MVGPPNRSDWRVLVGLMALTIAINPGCSERPGSKDRPGVRSSEFRKIRFAGNWVVVSFRSGSTISKVPEPSPGFVPRTGDHVVLSDLGDGDIFLAADLDSLRFYHTSPGADQLSRFQTLAETGKLFIVAKGTSAVVAKVVERELPEGLKSIEIRLLGEKGETAWVSESFVRGLDQGPKNP
jgi:hypothetical protein